MPIKLPASVLEAKGAFDHDPQRRRKDAVAHGTLGEAPDYFDLRQRSIWEELSGQIPVGLAKSADRMILEIAVRLIDKFRAKWLNGAELSILMNALGRFGMSPADRTRCAVPEDKTDKSESEFGEFVA